MILYAVLCTVYSVDSWYMNCKPCRLFHLRRSACFDNVKKTLNTNKLLLSIITTLVLVHCNVFSSCRECGVWGRGWGVRGLPPSLPDWGWEDLQIERLLDTGHPPARTPDTYYIHHHTCIHKCANKNLPKSGSKRQNSQLQFKRLKSSSKSLMLSISHS